MTFLILAMLLAFVQTAPPIPRQPANKASKQGQHLKTEARSSEAMPAKAPTVENPSKIQPAKTGSNDTTKDEEKYVNVRVPPINVNKDGVDYLSIIAGLLLTLATLLIAIYAVVQAGAAKANAEAALLNARAIINSERPWLFIDIKTSNAKTDENGTFQSLGFNVSFRNWGKTPAEIINFDQHTECRDDCENLPTPAKYRLEGHVWAHTRMVPAGEAWRDAESHFFATSFLLPDQWKDVQGSRKRFLYWGRLQYRDLIENTKTIHELKNLGTVHETCFCYFWSPSLNEFLICGPWGYNKHS